MMKMQTANDEMNMKMHLLHCLSLFNEFFACKPTYLDVGYLRTPEDLLAVVQI